jgi:hypothetical protein
VKSHYLWIHLLNTKSIFGKPVVERDLESFGAGVEVT